MHNLNKTVSLLVSCPWCGAAQEHTVRSGAAIDIVCNGGIASTSSSSRNWCNRPIRVEIDKNGKVKHVQRIIGDDRGSTSFSTNYVTRVAMGESTTTEVYEQTLALIRDSRNAGGRKAEAEDVLKYVKTHAPYFLPVVADGLKKMFYL